MLFILHVKNGIYIIIQNVDVKIVYLHEFEYE